MSNFSWNIPRSFIRSKTKLNDKDQSVCLRLSDVTFSHHDAGQSSAPYPNSNSSSPKLLPLWTLAQSAWTPVPMRPPGPGPPATFTAAASEGGRMGDTGPRTHGTGIYTERPGPRKRADKGTRRRVGQRDQAPPTQQVPSNHKQPVRTEHQNTGLIRTQTKSLYKD